MNREQHLEKALKSIIDFGDKEAPISYFLIRDIAREAILRPAEPAPVDNVALLEWVGVEQWEYRGEGKWIRNERTRYRNKFVRKTTAALIQEFINQKTKEV